MKISIKNFEKNISKTFLSAGKNNFDTNKVREFDEESKDNFVAFVDDGAESYDVHIVLDDKQNILTHTCDCSEEYLYCTHQIAVLYQLQLGAKSTTVKIPKAKKQTPSQALLATISHEAITTFLAESFVADKLLELKFLNYFAAATSKTTLTDAKKNMDTAKKMVVKTKKKIEKSELTQIINLCNPIFNNFVKQTDSDMNTDSIADVFDLINHYEQLLHSFQINSNLPEKTIEKLSIEKFNYIDKVVDTASKDTVKLFAVKSIFIDKAYRSSQLKALIAYLNTQSSNEALFMLNLLKLEMRKMSSTIKGFSQMQDKLLPLVLEKQIFKQLKNDFTILHFDNAHNKLLIDALLQIQDYELAETYCQQVIRDNYHDMYNVHYYEKLVVIYEHQNNKAKVLIYKMKLCIERPNYEIYKSVIEALQNDEAKKDFIKKTTNTLNRNIHHLEYESMYIKIMLMEEKFTAIFNRLDSTQTLLHAVNNFEILVKNNKKRLLQILLARENGYHWQQRSEEQKDQNYFEDLKALVKQYYTPIEFNTIYIEYSKKRNFHNLGKILREEMKK
jgi:SWIM zinc finger